MRSHTSRGSSEITTMIWIFSKSIWDFWVIFKVAFYFLKTTKKCNLAFLGCF